MKNVFLRAALGAGLLLCAGAYAADAPPAGAIAQCKDGTYFTGTTHSGACKGHQGVKTWLDKDTTAASSAKSKSSAAPASATSSSTAASTDSKKTKSKTSSASAASSTPAPAGATAKCKDGTYYTGTAHSGACKGHKGVAEWLDGGTSAAAAKTAPATPATPAPTSAAPAGAAPTAPAATAGAPAPVPTAATPQMPAAGATHTTPTPASQITAKPGGGAGQVWVNSASKVYHCQGDEWYGKTKEGSYMTEAAAKAAGNRAARGKECGG